MEKFNPEELKKLHKPSSLSHKGQNGKLMIIGGSHLFHGASLWALKVASRIVDMVFYSSVSENNEIAHKLKSEMYDLIVVPRDKIEHYIDEAEVVLIGPGLPREEGREKGEESTRSVVEKTLKKFPTRLASESVAGRSKKKWVIDGGALTEMNPEWIKLLNGNVIITPHHKEFCKLFNIQYPISNIKYQMVQEKAREYNTIILLKGEKDVVCSKDRCVEVKGGNSGMTKGGTGDVLAGLVAALACKNNLFLAATSASFINKKAGESLFEKVGTYFNASDLADEIPRVLRTLALN